MILAGPGVNILIAFVLFWAVLFSGNLNGAAALGNLDPSVQTVADEHIGAAIERGKRRRRRAAARRPASSRSDGRSREHHDGRAQRQLRTAAPGRSAEAAAPRRPCS